jgi:hypothetical protein
LRRRRDDDGNLSRAGDDRRLRPLIVIIATATKCAHSEGDYGGDRERQQQ